MPPANSNDASPAERSGLPAELLHLRKIYPRETWAEHANLGEWARFWLSRHAMFREVDAMLTEGCGRLQAQTIGVGEFTPWLVPRLNFLFGHLDLHHQIEEHHIFPAFARAEPGLQRGFDLLESDHRAIHTLVDAVQAAATRLVAAGAAGGGDARAAGDDTVRELAALVRGLDAHLADEEDLIVPIVLDRGEANLDLF